MSALGLSFGDKGDIVIPMRVAGIVCASWHELSCHLRPKLRDYHKLLASVLSAAVAGSTCSTEYGVPMYFSPLCSLML